MQGCVLLQIYDYDYSQQEGNVMEERNMATLNWINNVFFRYKMICRKDGIGLYFLKL